jgi:ADP-dependent phosphofructokinase/glucokinase
MNRMLQCSILNPFHILKTYHSYWKESVKSIAETMVKYKIALLLKNHLPIGIITDKDLRSKIATECSL